MTSDVFFCIAKLHRDDIVGMYMEDYCRACSKKAEEGVWVCLKTCDNPSMKNIVDIVNNMSDDEMQELAGDMGNAYLESGYWIDLKILFEGMYL